MIRRVIMPLALAGSIACGLALEPYERPVVNIDGITLTRGELEAYLALNLAGAEEFENDSAGEADQRDLVRSRLLDTWIDERLVLSEAAERRLTIDDEQLDEQLDDPSYESGAGDRRSRRAYLRNRLLIESNKPYLTTLPEQPRKHVGRNLTFGAADTIKISPGALVDIKTSRYIYTNDNPLAAIIRNDRHFADSTK